MNANIAISVTIVSFTCSNCVPRYLSDLKLLHLLRLVQSFADLSVSRGGHWWSKLPIEASVWLLTHALWSYCGFFRRQTIGKVHVQVFWYPVCEYLTVRLRSGNLKKISIYMTCYDIMYLYCLLLICDVMLQIFRLRRWCCCLKIVLVYCYFNEIVHLLRVRVWLLLDASVLYKPTAELLLHGLVDWCEMRVSSV